MRALLRSACCLQLAFSQISQARLSKTDKDPEQHRTTRPQTTPTDVARGEKRLIRDPDTEKTIDAKK